MFNISHFKQGVMAFVACTALAMPALAKDVNGTINVNGVKRSYVVHVPNKLASSQKVPLVLMLHGGGGGPQSIVRSSNMSDKADQEGFIVAYPAGIDSSPGPIKGTWNASGCCAGAMRDKVDDIGFISALIDQLKASYNIDAKRVYIGGMSNGAMMSNRVAAVLSDKIAAAGIVSGAIFSTQPAAGSPVPVIMFHGLQDDMVPYNGGTSPNRLVASSQSLPFKSAPEDFAYWKAQNKCSGTVKVEKFSDYTRTQATSCASGTNVALYAMHNGGHEWPSTSSTRGIMRGASTPASINATDIMWDFFSAHAKQ